MSDFSNVFIVPTYSDIERGGVDLSSYFFDKPMRIPILSSPMDTVTGMDMLQAMYEYGCYGVHHRYCDAQTLVDASAFGAIAVSPSIDIDSIKRVLCNPSGTVVFDVAHGNTKRNLEYCSELVKRGFNVVSGSLCTPAAVESYYNIGVRYMRVGIGGGSACTTRIVTGVGIPQPAAILNIRKYFNNDVKIISDGGHATTGDIAKALVLGADFVMLGGMLAPTKEALGRGVFSGMASAEALRRRGKTEFFVEGRTFEVGVKTTVKDVLSEIEDALDTTCYYTGSSNLKELRGKYILEHRLYS